MKPAILYYNAKIYCNNETFDIASAMIVEDSKIRFVGELDLSFDRSNYIQVDCKGAFIYPGFIDPHCHFIDLGKSYFTAKLHDAKSPQEIVEICEDFHQKEAHPWLLGRGWNQNNWLSKELPTKELLDERFPDVPVLLIRIDSHVGWLNSKALELSGVVQEKFIREAQVQMNDGKATGIIYDKALYHVLELVKPDIATKTKFIQKATDICFSYGLTSVGDAFMTYEDLQLYIALNESEQLRIKLFGMLTPSAENKQYLVENGKYQHNLLRIQATKHFADGALGSRGAALMEPYSDALNTQGMLLESDEYWEQEAQFCMDNQLQMITHAIGDAANKRVINLYAKFLKKSNDLRWRVEHLQMIDEEDLDHLKKCSIVPSIQSTHGTSDYSWAIDRIGQERMQKSYRIKDILDACGMFANGSDFPIEKPNPLRGFYASTCRKDDQHLPENGFAPDQKVSRVAALKSMTIWAAYAQFEEDTKGSLEVNKQADFVMLDTDLLTCNEQDILAAKVLQTYVNGKCVFDIAASQ